MADPLLDDLREQVRRGDVAVVAGAGISIGAVRSDEERRIASWTGLLKHGVSRCVDLKLIPLPEGWADRQSGAIDSGDLGEIVGAAEQITEKLGGREHGEYRRWLRETAGSLSAHDTAVIEPLHGLGPLLTTNYDGLLEQVTGLEPVTWREGALVDRVLRGREEAVLHLHGHWRDPASLVLGLRSYDAVLGDAQAQHTLRALLATKTLLFVGCGAGLQDPNLGALLRWLGDVYAGSEQRHYRLARAGEADELRDQHPPEQRLALIEYGAEHAELAAFLRELAAARTKGSRVGATPPGAPEPSRVFLPAARAEDCFGRDDEIRDLVGTLLCETAPIRPTAILGPPGIGKSTLALVALHDAKVSQRYGEGRYFVRCDSATDRVALIGETALAIGVTPGPDLEARVLGALAARPTALVLDNAETPWEADTAGTEELLALLAALQGLALVVAMRGEQRPQGVGWREAIHLRPLREPDAVEAFLAQAGARFRDDPDVLPLVTAQDGVPLALKLLAYAAESEPGLAGTWRDWQHRRVEILRRPDREDRLSSVAVSFELSIRGPRMNDDARRLLTLLGRLPDGIAHLDLPAVLPDAGEEAARILRRVALAFDEGGRLRVLAPLREYAARHLPPDDTDLEIAVAHYLELAETHGPKAGAEGGAEAIERLAAEMGNLDAAVELGLAQADPDDAIVAAYSLVDFLCCSGIGEARALDSARIRAQEVDDVPGEADCTHGLGDIAWARSDPESARLRFDEALALYRRTRDVQGEANCIFSLGDIALAQSDHDTARQRYDDALLLYRRAGSVLGEANSIKSLGDIALAKSDHDTARQRYDDALLLHRRVGGVLGEAGCIASLGQIALERDDDDTAQQRYDEALPLYRRVGSLAGEAMCIESLGQIALGRSDLDTAGQRLGEALRLYRRAGSVGGEASSIKSLGDIALAQSDHDTAQLRYDEALPLYRRVGDILGQANCIHSLGDVAQSKSDPGAARSRYEEALDLYERIPEPYSIGHSHVSLAELTGAAEREAHLEAARAAWKGIGREDLIAEYLDVDDGDGDGTES